MPERLAKMACVLMSLRSGEENCDQAPGPASPPPRLLWPPHLTLHDVQDQARVLVGMEKDHVAQRAICECRAQYRDVVLGECRTGQQQESDPGGDRLVPILAASPLCLILGMMFNFSGPVSLTVK